MSNRNDKPLTLEEVRQAMKTLVTLGVLSEVGPRESDGEMIYRVGGLDAYNALTARPVQHSPLRELRARRKARRVARRSRKK